MINISIIYKITNPSGKVYIGQTINLKARKRKYAAHAVQGQPKIHHSILKYGWDNHTFDIIFQGICSADCLNKLERLYILQYNSVTEGLNCTEGGGGARGRLLSEKHLEALKKPKSGAHKAKMKAAATGRKMSKELIEKRSASRSKPIEQWTIEGIFIREWINPNEAAIGLGLPRHNGSSIRACALGKASHHTAYGYVWRRKS